MCQPSSTGLVLHLQLQSRNAVQIEAPEEVDVPSSLLPEEEVEQLVAELNPHFIPLAGSPPGSSATPPADPTTGNPLYPSLSLHKLCA